MMNYYTNLMPGSYKHCCRFLAHYYRRDPEAKRASQRILSSIAPNLIPLFAAKTKKETKKKIRLQKSAT